MWLTWWTYYRCLRKHLKCHFLQMQLNNSFYTCIMNRLKCHLFQLVLTIDLPFPHQVLSLGNQNYLNKEKNSDPTLDSIKSFEERKDRKGKDTFDLSDGKMGGSQTVKHYQDSCTCCVKCWPTSHGTAHLPYVRLCPFFIMKRLCGESTGHTTCVVKKNDFLFLSLFVPLSPLCWSSVMSRLFGN